VTWRRSYGNPRNIRSLDGRSATARRFRDLVNAFVTDMGGLDRGSEVRLGLVRRLAATTVQAEMLEARMVNGEAIDIATLCTLASTTVRLSQRLGLERRARNVTPSVGEDLATRTAPATGDRRGGDRMIPRVTLHEALSDPNLLGTAIAGDSWRSWRALLIAAMGESLTEDERAIFSQLTSREREPLQRIDQFAAVIGRSVTSRRCRNPIVSAA
jgi:hypothetical protein